MLLERTPWLEPYWDFKADPPECDLERLEADMSAWSHGERLMAEFMVGVWSGKNRLLFDPIEAASVLDPEFRALVAEWVKHPFWP